MRAYDSVAYHLFDLPKLIYGYVGRHSGRVGTAALTRLYGHYPGVVDNW